MCNYYEYNALDFSLSIESSESKINGLLFEQ